MEKISTEDIVSSTLALGYDQVDSIFITEVVAQGSLDQKFEFEEKEYSSDFLNLIDYDGFVYKLKRNKVLTTIITNSDGKECTVRELLSKNKNLCNFIANIDLQKIVNKKIRIIGKNNIKEYISIFSNKERELLPKKKNKYDNQTNYMPRR